MELRIYSGIKELRKSFYDILIKPYYMKKKNLIILFIIVAASLIVGLVCYLNFSNLNCDEEVIILEGKLGIVQNKYPINVIETEEGTYWMYGAPEDFEENLNKRVRIEAILSPSSCARAVLAHVKII